MKDLEYKFNPSQELLDFADYFSNNFKTLSASVIKDKKEYPSTYRSNDGNYLIDYFYKIRDTKTNKVVNTNIRVSHNTGIIQISKSKIISQECTPEYIFYIILWCIVEREVNDIVKADRITFEYYLTTGKSIKNLLTSYIKSLDNKNYPINKKRLKLIMDMADNHKKQTKTKK